MLNTCVGSIVLMPTLLAGLVYNVSANKVSPDTSNSLSVPTLLRLLSKTLFPSLVVLRTAFPSMLIVSFIATSSS